MVTSWLLLPNHNVSHLDSYFPIKIPILVQEPDWNPWNYHFPRSFSIFFPQFFRHFPFISPHFFICFIIVLDNFMQFPTFSHHFLTIFLHFLTIFSPFSYIFSPFSHHFPQVSPPFRAAISAPVSFGTAPSTCPRWAAAAARRGEGGTRRRARPPRRSRSDPGRMVYGILVINNEY